MPVLSIDFSGVLFLGFFVICCVVFVLTITGIISKWFWALPGTMLLAYIIILISSTGIFHASDYRALIGTVEEKDFSTEISPIDLSKIPVVDEELAINLGEKKLGEQVALGSQVELGDFTLINVNDELYWVAPLVHSGFFKWITNKEGTPGYVKINAANPRDITLVQEINDQPISIKYQPQSYFNQDLHRLIYKAGYQTVGLTDFSFELDDAGRPYWVVTKYDKTIGFAGKKAQGVIAVDAQTGEISDYDMAEIPGWVDRVIPVDFALKQLNDWGRYVNGWWNPSSKGILKTTNGYNFIYNNGKCYIYTGLTSVGGDESTVGFTLIDTRTKETVFYKVSGSQETAAMQSAEGKVQNLGYTSTFPILINVNKEPTYFMTLKDKKGLVKLYAMVNVEDYSIVGTGESITAAESNYIKNLKNRGDWQGLGDSGDAQSLDGTVERIGSSYMDDTTYYYLILKEKPDKIFMSAINMSNELPLTIEGDRVSIEYIDNTNSSIDLIRFDNLKYEQTVTGEEANIINENEEIETRE